MVWLTFFFFFYFFFSSYKVEIKRTIPKGAGGSKDFKTKKIFVGGIPTTVNDGISYCYYYCCLCTFWSLHAWVYWILTVGHLYICISTDEFREFFSQFGEVKEHQIMRDHSTSRSRGFGFVTFDTEQEVDDLLSKGNKLELAGSQVSWVPIIALLEYFFSPTRVQILWDINSFKL